MKKNLEINNDYASIFGYEKPFEMIFLGGNSWKLVKPGAEQVIESEKMTKNALDYINQPSVNMGNW